MGKNTLESDKMEQRATDILEEFSTRPTLIERLCARLRPLRPPVCTSKRFFDYFELPDPYHPIDYAREYKSDIGPSVLILGENRRQVAPHATVPPLKSRIEPEKPKAPQAFRPQGVPSAPTRDSTSKPPTPPPKPSSGEFGQRSKHPLKKIPVRPDLAGSSTNSQGTIGNDNKIPTLNRSVPRPTTNDQTEHSRSGNLRMRRSTISNPKPKVTSLNTPSVPSTESTSPVSNSVPQASINRSPSAATGEGGLDDLFGFGAQEGRMKLPRRSSTQKTPMVQQNRGQPTPTSPQSEALPPPSSVSPRPQAPVTAAPVNRSPSAASGSGGLDDLFGFGAQEGRMRIPKRTQSNASDAESSSSAPPDFDRNPRQSPDSSKN